MRTGDVDVDDEGDHVEAVAAGSSTARQSLLASRDRQPHAGPGGALRSHHSLDDLVELIVLDPLGVERGRVVIDGDPAAGQVAVERPSEATDVVAVRLWATEQVDRLAVERRRAGRLGHALSSASVDRVESVRLR